MVEAETNEQRVRGGEVMIHANIERILVEPLDRVREIVSGNPTGNVGEWKQVHEGNTDGVQPVRGNDVSGEGIAHQNAAGPGARRSRIVNDAHGRIRKAFGKVAAPHLFSRHGGEEGEPLADAHTLVIPKEEGFIFENGAAKRAAKLVLVVLSLLGSIEEVAGVDVIVAQELEGGPVEYVCARFGIHQHGRAAAAPVLGGIVEGKDLELLNGVNGGHDGNGTRGQFVVVNAVQKPVVGVFPHALDRKGDAAADGDLSVPAVVKESTLAFNGAGCQRTQLNEVAAV